VRVLVAESGDLQLGERVKGEGDIAADFRAAFGEPPPTLSGLAVGADADQTHGRAHAGFGAIPLQSR
jgi:hypothetical protein